MRFACLTVAVFLVGCVSTHMKQYIGSDIREVVLDSGMPTAVMDLGSGRRAFQFRWGGGAIAVPSVTTVSGSAVSSSYHSWFAASSITSGGGVFSSEGCYISYVTLWEEKRKSWVVHDIRYPKTTVC